MSMTINDARTRNIDLHNVIKMELSEPCLLGIGHGIYTRHLSITHIDYDRAERTDLFNLYSDSADVEQIKVKEEQQDE